MQHKTEVDFFEMQFCKVQHKTEPIILILIPVNNYCLNILQSNRSFALFEHGLFALKAIQKFPFPTGNSLPDFLRA